MEIENTSIPGLKILHLSKFHDVRGTFLKIYNHDFFENNNLRSDFKESYFTISHKNVIRGMHFQNPPFDHVKLVYLIQGQIIDCVLDIRKESPVFGKFHSIELREDTPKLIYIPQGCAHGFESIRDNSVVTYLQTSVYNPDSDAGIHFNSFSMQWSSSQPVVSSRDQSFPNLSDFISPF
jgi:dTDP-4-dehydrorhamnose 3,5-epimerase/CDP-3, 6-dideoxy-D-glycero-D-glycero-4-hexulose-5-epimerase